MLHAKIASLTCPSEARVRATDALEHKDAEGVRALVYA
jgi:hypothetical protein